MNTQKRKQYIKQDKQPNFKLELRKIQSEEAKMLDNLPNIDPKIKQAFINRIINEINDDLRYNQMPS
jgi:hypothetical protein